ncbi:FAD-dependent oxidoreductase [Mesorhizobium sp. GR13]|uniref:FAD-dependent oxidoreductase n=1 Tax=Mesorhizobium sp. GR13 TaxID=2562308 RepID=UPI0010C0FE7C|nr:FAD-dependent oxidoreductase [Mesorhizobium sp. GR13]
MSPRTVVVVGASEIGCRFALAANAAGHRVILIDEHPQALKGMSIDAPYFYGAGLPAALNNANAIAQTYLEANPELMECLDSGIDVRLSTILWGAFRNSENAIHIGTPKVGLVSRDGNELVDHDILVIASGVRDFVPSFQGWELPGVFGAKAGLALLDSYGVFEGERVLILGTSDIAVRLMRSLSARQITIAGVVEPGETIAAGSEAAAWIESEGIPVHFGKVIASAKGKVAVECARLIALDGAGSEEIACDSIAVAVATLPNIELPAAMGCRMRFSESLASWVPEVSVQGETNLDGVFYLASSADESMVDAMLSRISGEARDERQASPSPNADASAYIRKWIEILHRTGGADVIMCQCESVTRREFCHLEPPKYLGQAMRGPQVPTSHTDNPEAPHLNQDLVKRMTRVGMGHCQGKRCRDEAAFTLMQRFGIGAEDIRPGSYRFPLRPLDLPLIADDDETDDIRLNWQMWPYETRNA